MWKYLPRSAVVAAMAFGTLAPAAAAQHPPTYIEPLARVPYPGAPQGVTFGPDGRVWTQALNQDARDPKVPSPIWAFSRDGDLTFRYELEGQDVKKKHGLSKVIFDGEGRAYTVDQQGPVVWQIDLAAIRRGEKGQRVYATFADVPPCNGSNEPNCSPGAEDFEAVPDYLVFDHDGTMYVTDSLQGLVWRIPRGGGAAQVWFKDPLLQPGMGAPAYGPSGLRLLPDRSLIFTSCVQRFGTTSRITSGFLVKVPIRPDGGPGEMQVLWETQPNDCPGDIEVGRSGTIYFSVPLPGQQITALSPAPHRELWRAPETPVENALLEIPMDMPLGLALDDRGRLLVGNTSFFRRDPNSYAILAMDVGDLPLAPAYPHLGRKPAAESPGAEQQRQTKRKRRAQRKCRSANKRRTARRRAQRNCRKKSRRSTRPAS